MNRRTARYSPLQQILRLWSCRFYHQLIAKETSLFSGLLVGASHQRPGVSGVTECGIGPVRPGAWSQPRHGAGDTRHWVSCGVRTPQSASLWSPANTGWGEGEGGSLELSTLVLNIHICISTFLEWLTVLHTFLLYHKKYILLENDTSTAVWEWCLLCYV